MNFKNYKDKQMKLTKEQLRQIIKEELSRALKESDEVRASPPRWSTGGEDPWQPTSTRWTGMPSRGGGNEEELLTALRATGARSWADRDIADVAKVAAEAARKAALDADPHSQTADAVVYNAIIEYFRSKSRR
jgi:hypothetical protein